MKEHPLHKGYFVTEDGKVFTTIRPGGVNGKGIKNAPPKELKPSEDIKGYQRVNIQVGKYNQKKFAVHRLVAETYLENPNNYPVIHHKDKNPRNNNVSNLEWCTHKQNCHYSRDNIGQNKAEKWLIENINTKETFYVYNMSYWCEQNGLNRANLHKTLTKKVNHHKGFRILRKGD